MIDLLLKFFTKSLICPIILSKKLFSSMEPHHQCPSKKKTKSPMIYVKGDRYSTIRTLFLAMSEDIKLNCNRHVQRNVG